jgi:hypothetical protein
MKRQLAIIALSLTLATAAQGTYFEDGNKLLDECSHVNDMKGMACLGYVQGAADMLEAIAHLAGKPECIRNGVQTGQVKDVIVRYLKANPANRHFRAAYLASEAIGEAFCPDDAAVVRIPEQKPEWKKIPTPVKKPAKPLELDTE